MEEIGIHLDIYYFVIIIYIAIDRLGYLKFNRTIIKITLIVNISLNF